MKFKTFVDFVNTKTITIEDSIIMVCFLYENNIIGKSKFLYMAKSYHNQNYLAVSKIDCWFDERWYNTPEISKSKIIEKLMIFLRCSKKLATTFFANYVAESLPMFGIPQREVVIFLQEMGVNIKTYEEMDNEGRLDSGYCCTHCDGSIDSYKDMKYEASLPTRDRIRKTINLV